MMRTRGIHSPPLEPLEYCPACKPAPAGKVTEPAEGSVLRALETWSSASTSPPVRPWPRFTTTGLEPRVYDLRPGRKGNR